MALLALVIVAALILTLTQCGGDRTANRDQNTNGAVPPAGSQSAPANSVPPASGQPGRLTADGRDVFPLAQGDLTSFVGKSVSGSAVMVQSVPGPEGFWAGENAADRVWVKLLPSGDSPVDVKPGQLLDLTGTVVANGDGFAAKERVDGANGAEQLDRQKAHIEVSHDQPRVVGSR
ncbi:hypothetical protein ACFQ05_39340 [Amycolatopsis umgeniensis]|uniref:DUF5666 domain-containing protein n=1 Tax=Amycolatopsis umgeniensis TaxID=336628 RepID=A0A841AZ26_9PSEU|nr:hypothetical protein [Amycolatopsis umgeniensis]MBB5851348.1 hypothetical protein [Amycolatopsis umgeniensis]